MNSKKKYLRFGNRANSSTPEDNPVDSHALDELHQNVVASFVHEKRPYPRASRFRS